MRKLFFIITCLINSQSLLLSVSHCSFSPRGTKAEVLFMVTKQMERDAKGSREEQGKLPEAGWVEWKEDPSIGRGLRLG